MYGVGISPHDSSLMHVSCDMGTFYVSEDGGSSWKIVDQLEMTGIRSTRPLYHPVNPDIVIMPYYRGAVKQLRISYDRGMHWEILSGKVTVASFRAAMADRILNYSGMYSDKDVERIVSELVRCGVVNSRRRLNIRWIKKLPDEFKRSFPGYSDYKLSCINDVLLKIHEVPWKFSGSGMDDDRKHDEGVTSMAMDPVSSDIIFVSTVSGLFRSEDGGASFRRIEIPGISRGVYISPVVNNHPRYIAAVGDTVYISDDGKDWKKSGAGLSGMGHAIYGFAAAMFGTAPGKPIYCYVATNDGIYYSHDSGRTFVRNRNKSDLISIFDTNPKMRFRFVSLSEKNPLTAYVSNYYSNWNTYGVFKTVDGGVTWKNVYDPYGKWGSHGTIHSSWIGNSYHILDRGWGGRANCITAAPGNPDIVAYVNAMEFYLTKDGGRSWYEKSSRYFDTRGAYKSDFSFSGNGLEVALPTNMIWDPYTKGRCYLIYGDLIYFVSSDYGRSWKRKVSGIPAEWGSRMWELIPDTKNKNVLYAAVSNNHDSVQQMIGYKDGRKRGGVLISRDGGDSWVSISGGDIKRSWFEAQHLNFRPDEIDDLLSNKLKHYVDSLLVDNDMNKNGPPVVHKRLFFAKRGFSGIGNVDKGILRIRGYSKRDIEGIERVLNRSRESRCLPFDEFPCTGLAVDSEHSVVYALYPVKGVYRGRENRGEWEWDRLTCMGLGRYGSEYGRSAFKDSGPGTGKMENKIFEQLHLGPDGSLYCIVVGRQKDWGWQFGTYPDGGVWRLDQREINNPEAQWVEITSGLTQSDPSAGHGLCDPKYYTIDMKSLDRSHPRVFISSSYQAGGEKDGGLWEGDYDTRDQRWNWKLILKCSDLNSKQYLYGWIEAGDVSIHPEKPYIYYSTKTHGLWMSENNGKAGTWHRVLGIPRLSTGKVSFEPGYPDIIYVSSVGLWKGPANGIH
jgi:photosystem II stability/assembly factor-like uncharacterized protein